MAQTVQILRTTTNNPPATLLPGSFSVELGTDTRLWMGAAGGNRLLLSSNSADVDLAADCTISATAPAVGTQTGVLWFDTVGGGLFVRFNDGSSTQWIQPVSAGSALNVQVGPGLTLNTSTSPPTIDFANPFPQAMTINAALRVQTAGMVIGPAATAAPAAGALTLNANTVAPPAGGGGNLYVAGADNTGPFVNFDAFGTQATNIWARRSRGTAAAPTGVQSGDNLLVLYGVGRTSAGAYSAGNAPTIQLQASEAWTGTAQGSAINLQTTVNGSTAAVNSLTLAGNTATFSGTVSTGSSVTVGNVLTVNGQAVMQQGLSVGGLQTGNAGGAFQIQADLIITGGNATKATGSTWINPSSRDIKNDIQPYDKGLQAVLALKPSTYRFQRGLGLPEGRHIGLVHDETAHMPEMHTKAVLGGTPDKPGREVDALDCSAVTWALCNAIKELTKRLEKLEGAK